MLGRPAGCQLLVLVAVLMFHDLPMSCPSDENKQVWPAIALCSTLSRQHTSFQQLWGYPMQVVCRRGQSMV